MKTWNKKYDIDHDEMEEKLSDLANDLQLTICEIEAMVEDIKENEGKISFDEICCKIRESLSDLEEGKCCFTCFNGSEVKDSEDGYCIYCKITDKNQKESFKCSDYIG